MNWQPIETAPRNGQVILASDERGLIFPVALIEEAETAVEKKGWFGKTREVIREAGLYVYGTVPLNGGYGRLAMRGEWHPTHWMPLPSPPATAE